LTCVQINPDYFVCQKKPCIRAVDETYTHRLPNPVWSWMEAVLISSVETQEFFDPLPSQIISTTILCSFNILKFHL